MSEGDRSGGRHGQVVTDAAERPTASTRERAHEAPPRLGDLQYGLGILKLDDWAGHAGLVPGYNDHVWYLPAQKATVVVAVNGAPGETAFPVWSGIVKAWVCRAVHNFCHGGRMRGVVHRSRGVRGTS